MGKVLGWVGGVVTTLWVALLAAYVVSKWGKIVELEPNALGDLLGGSMGPLALFWLVLGYLQQGIELRQNGAALNLQAEELKHAVDQYKEMARVANEQLIHDKEAAIRAADAALELRKREKAAMQPNFSFSGSGGSHSNTSEHKFVITNTGSSAYEVKLNFNDGTAVNRSEFSYWSAKQDYEIIFVTPRLPKIDAKELTITYRDSEGDRSSMVFVASFINSGQDYCAPVFNNKFF